MQPGTVLDPGLAAVGTEWASKRTTQTTLARSYGRGKRRRRPTRVH